MSYLYLLLIVEVVLLLIIAIVTKADFTSPGFITLFMFILSTLCVIWNEDYWRVQFTYKTFKIISSGLFIIVFVEILVSMIAASNSKRVWSDREDYAKTKEYDIPVLTQVFFSIIFTAMTLVYIIAIVRAGGNSSLLANIGAVHNDTEIEVGTIPTICIRILRLSAFPFLFFFINNVLRCKGKILKNILLLVPVLDSLIAVFFSGVRSTFMYYIIAAIFYSVMLTRFQNGWKQVKLRKYLKHIIFFGGAFIFLFIASRSIVKNREYQTSGIEYLTFYLGSPIHLFNKIVDRTYMAFPTFYTDIPGAHTFKLFYHEMYKFGFIDQKVEDTRFVYVGGSYSGGGNVYTFFGPSYHDFGLIGMLVYVAIFYLIFNYIYYKCFRYNSSICKNIPWLVLFGAYYHYVFMTFYSALTCQFKLQTILEMMILVIIFKELPKLKIRMRKW